MKLDRHLLASKVSESTGLDRKEVLKVIDSSMEHIRKWLIGRRDPVEFRGIMTLYSTINPAREGKMFGKEKKFSESIGIVVKKSKKLIQKFREREKEGIDKLKGFFD